MRQSDLREPTPFVFFLLRLLPQALYMHADLYSMLVFPTSLV